MKKTEGIAVFLIALAIGGVVGGYLCGYGDTFTKPGYVILGTNTYFKDPGTPAWTEVKVNSTTINSSFSETIVVKSVSTVINWQNRSTSINYENVTLNNGSTVELWSNISTIVVAVSMIIGWVNPAMSWINLSTPSTTNNISVNGPSLQHSVALNETGPYEILDASDFPLPTISNYTLGYNQTQSISYSYNIYHPEVEATTVEATPARRVEATQEPHYGNNTEQYKDGFYFKGKYYDEEDYDTTEDFSYERMDTFTWEEDGDEKDYSWPHVVDGDDRGEYRIYDPPKRNYVNTRWWDRPDPDWSNSLVGRLVISITIIGCTLVAGITWFKTDWSNIGTKKKKAGAVMIACFVISLLTLILIPIFF